MTDELETLRNNLPLYTEAALKIRTKEEGFQYLKLNEAQRIVHEKVSEQWKREGRVRAVVLKARQEGVSTYVAARFFRRIHLWPATSAMVVADSLERAGVLYDIYARYFEHLPRAVKPDRKNTNVRKRLSFTHDSEVVVRPASDREAGRAMTLHLLHASELAFWGENALETWVSLQQAVPAKGSEVIVESTAKGAGGFFHELWEAASTGEAGWLAIFLPWWIHDEYEVEPSDDLREILRLFPDDFENQATQVGIPYEGQLHKLSIRKLAWRRLKIVEAFGGTLEHLGKDATRAFQQEYPATAEEAFLVSGACFFDEEQLRKLSAKTFEAEKRGRLVSDGSTITLEPSARGFLRIYEQPDPRKHYVIGADTSEGKLVSARRVEDTLLSEQGGRDFSAAEVLEVETRKVVAELHGRIAPEVFAEQLRLLGNYYACGGELDGTLRSPALVGVERSHSSGMTVLRLLREHYRYPRLYWRREMNKLTRKIGRVLGWVTSVETRMPMLDELAYFVRQEGAIEIPSKDLVREMITFVVWPDGKPAGEEGCHDDRVIALAIAVQMAREHRHALAGPMPTYEINEESMTG